MKRYIFTVELAGIGNTSEEGWQDAIDAFSRDPRAWHELVNEEDLIDWL